MTASDASNCPRFSVTGLAVRTASSNNATSQSDVTATATANARRRRRSPAGNGTAGFSGDGMAGTAAQLNSPVDVDCDAAGNIYISDRDNNAIRKVDNLSGVITTIAGDGAEGYTGDKGPATAARLRTPGGIYVVRTGAQAGRIYVADTYNGVIRVIWE